MMEVVCWPGLVTVGLLQVALVAGAADLGDTTDTRQTCRPCLTMLVQNANPSPKYVESLNKFLKYESVRP